MSGFKSIAVAGAGNIGTYLIDELLHYKETGYIDSVSVLTRTSSSSVVPAGANHLRVDYDSPSSLISALQGADVVIATFGQPALPVQYPLAQAAKAAGVKLFVPSEFGNPTEGKQGRMGPFDVKPDFHVKLEALGLPYALYFTGPWPEFCLSPLFGWDLPNGKVTISGSGTAPISFTARTDVVRFIVHSLVNLPANELQNRVFRIEGERTTYNDIVLQYQAETGKPLEVIRRSREGLEAAARANPADIFLHLLVVWDDGEGVVGEGDNLSNGVWPEWNPKTVVSALLQ